MMINEDRTMVGSLGEEMCAARHMAIASLKHFHFPECLQNYGRFSRRRNVRY